MTTAERDAFCEYVHANPQCSIKVAAEAVGLRRRDIRMLRRSDPEFEEDYRTARGYGGEAIWNQVVKLAIEGVEEPIVSMGAVVATKRVYSERMLQTMVTTLTPEGLAAAGSKVGIEIHAGDVKVQGGVALEDVLAFMQKHVPQAALEEPVAGEIIAETEEEIE